MTDHDLLYVLTLQNIAKIGDITAKKLIQHCGSAEAVLKEKHSNLLKIDGIGSILVNAIPNGYTVEAENELRFIKNQKIECFYFLDENYPERLKHCIDGPILLFSSGNINLNNQRVISIVGARKITTHGITTCQKLVEELALYNPIIVSGFAYGTDITAQRAAIENNLQTIGCLAHGLNQIYPKTHQKYVQQVKAYGGFFTDFWSTDEFDRKNFLKRNRIIAGLSEATIVIESAEKGGSLVTAEIANSYNRDVFAIPGRVTDTQSVGCNNLIKYQKAHLLSQAADIPYLLNWQLETEKKSVQKQLFVELNDEEMVIYNFLKQNGKELLDIIALQCKLPIFKVASILLNMELKGVLRPLPGKQYEII